SLNWIAVVFSRNLKALSMDCHESRPETNFGLIVSEYQNPLTIKNMATPIRGWIWRFQHNCAGSVRCVAKNFPSGIAIANKKRYHSQYDKKA
ncbi:MAG: hypothetical protein ACRERS_04260, partial [Methylococcales bacterium]